jgi:hypothetical protein
VPENTTPHASGTFSDFDDNVTSLTASEGAISTTGLGTKSGTWTWSESAPLTDGSHTVTITAKNVDGTTGTASFTFTATQVAPSLTRSGASVTVNENTTASKSGTWSDYDDTVTLKASQGTIVQNSNGTWSWSQTADDTASGTVTITATNADGATATVNFSVTFTDLQVTNLATGALPAGKLEGAGIGAITGIATFTDPAGPESVSDYTATIHWGDSTTSTGTVVFVSGNNFRVDAPSHTYAEEGTYTVFVTLKHDLLASVNTPSKTITIADASLTGYSKTLTGTHGVPLTNVVVASFTDADPGGTRTDYTATINWGDGHTSSGTSVAIVYNSSTGRFDVQGSHTYATSGNFKIIVTITDSGGSTVTVTDPITIADARDYNLLPDEDRPDILHELLEGERDAERLAAVLVAQESGRFSGLPADSSSACQTTDAFFGRAACSPANGLLDSDRMIWEHAVEARSMIAQGDSRLFQESGLAEAVRGLSGVEPGQLSNVTGTRAASALGLSLLIVMAGGQGARKGQSRPSDMRFEPNEPGLRSRTRRTQGLS